MSRSPLLRRIAIASLSSFTSAQPTSSIVASSQLSLSSASSSSSSSYSSQFAFSSHTQPPPYSKPPSAEHNDDIPSDVSTQELKQRISKYLEGDTEAIPSIFEAILARKLSGKHEDSDDEILEEFRSKGQHDEENGTNGSGFDHLDSDDDDEDLSNDSDDDLFEGLDSDDSDDELSD